MIIALKEARDIYQNCQFTALEAENCTRLREKILSLRHSMNFYCKSLAEINL